MPSLQSVIPLETTAAYDMLDVIKEVCWMFTIRLGVTYPIVFRDEQLLLALVKHCQQEKARFLDDVCDTALGVVTQRRT